MLWNFLLLVYSIFLCFRPWHLIFVMQKINLIFLNTLVAVSPSSFELIFDRVLIFRPIHLNIVLFLLWLDWFIYFFMQFILVCFFKLLTNTKTHQMIWYLDWNCPLRIVYIWEMIVFFRNFLCFSKNLFIVEFVIVSALEIEHPTFDLFRLRMNV